jgi:ABC-type bacteriocin/lantibiotic exporter with double-glycine peptidase domain
VLLAATLLVALGSALTTLWLPTVLSVTFGGRAGSGGTSALPFAVLAGVVIANTLILLVRSLVSLISATAVGKAMSEAVFSRMLRLPYGHLVHRGVGELLFTLDSVQRLRALITTDFIVVVVGLVMVGTLLVWLAVQSWTAALVALGLVALLALLALMSGRGVRRLSLEETRRRAELQSIQVTALSGLESIKTNAMEDHYVARWRRTNDAVQRYSVGLQSVQSGFTSLSASLQLVGPILIVLIITSGSSGGPVAATIVSVQALVGLLLGQVGQVTGSFSQVAQGWTLLERVSEIMVRPEDDTFAGAAAPPPGAEIAVLDVTFSYATFSPAVLDGVTLHVPAGAKVALVGPSGSGKSTLGRLIVGLSRPTTGQITIGGRELHEYGRHPFYSNVAYVPQNVVLDSGTLRDNIAWGAGEVDDDAILLAAERVGLSEDIAALPLGLDTPVAQLGQNFSGGQRQRVALARAALKRVSLVVLDEATSSLDNRAEATVTRYFSSLAATSVVIAHRLSTVIDADVIYVMAAGRVVEHGTHADLIRQDGLYRELYRRSSEQISVDG